MPVRTFPTKHLIAAGLAACTWLPAGSVLADAATPVDQAELLRQLTERIEKLEKANAELIQRLNGAASAAERQQQNQASAPVSLPASSVATPPASAQKAAALIDAVDGIKAGVSFTTVAQRADRGVKSDGSGDSALNYRGDVSVTLPAGALGEAQGKLFAHVRLGQGSGLAASTYRFSPPNATAFQLGGVSQPDDSAAMLAQAWYQMSVPLFRDAAQQATGQSLTFTFGKIDPYLFFDQNAVANDETRQFISSVFVHNALLDAGHDSGVDAYGFAPGMILAYGNEVAAGSGYGLSAGVFSAAGGAQYRHSFSSPFVIIQAEIRRQWLNGLDGNYRVYYWRNGQGVDLDRNFSRHVGWGLNLDQRLYDGLTVFARAGRQLRGQVQFDQTLSGGVEIGGSYWGRADDALGIAFGSQRSSGEFRNRSAMLDTNGDGIADFGYTAQGEEQMLELFYRFRVHKQFELSPDFQYLRHPGGKPDGNTIKAIGLRAQVSF